MKKHTTKIAAFLMAAACSAGLTSCGRDVPTAEDSGGEFSIAGGIDESGLGDELEATLPEPSAAETTAVTEAVSTETTTVNVAIVTRSKEELDKLAVATKPAATKPASNTNQSGNNSSGGNNNSSGGNGSSTKPSGGNGSGGNSTSTTPSGGGSGTSNGITLSYYSAELTVGQTKTYPVVAEVITEVWTSSDTSVATVDGYGNITAVGVGNCVIRVASANNSKLSAEVKVTVKSANSDTPTTTATPPQNTDQKIEVINGVTYVNDILIANKSYGLPSTYNPGGLTNETYSAFQELSYGASVDGLNIYISSGFRSYETQDEIYNNYVYWNGQSVADTFSARPGYSEHQTGLAIDVNDISDNFIGTPEAIWLEENCTEYGFIIRYPQGKQDITGYKYEPWHIRYVGKEAAKALKEAAAAAGDPHLTLEEYLEIDSYYH